MATRSMIAMEQADGSLLSIYIYCHWDGYTEHHLPILKGYYNTTKKVEALLALGDISILRDNVEPPDGVEHSFDNPAENVVIAYHRDRGDELVKAKSYPNLQNIFAARSDIEFVYVFTLKGEWKYSELNDHR